MCIFAFTITKQECLSGGIGRRARLKLVFFGVWVRFPPQVQKSSKNFSRIFFMSKFSMNRCIKKPQSNWLRFWCLFDNRNPNGVDHPFFFDRHRGKINGIIAFFYITVCLGYLVDIVDGNIGTFILVVIESGNAP